MKLLKLTCAEYPLSDRPRVMLVRADHVQCVYEPCNGNPGAVVALIGQSNDDATHVLETPEAIAAMLAEPVGAKCTWTYNENTCHWDGTCGVAWTMIAGRLLENHMHYCPRCGGKISEVT